MSETRELTHAAPADQPTHVRQIAERFFPAYTIDGGRVHLAGCALEDRPFMRLVFRRQTECAELYLDEDGAEVDAEIVRKLGMNETVPLPRSPVLVTPDVEPLLLPGTRLAEQRLPGTGPPELIERTIVWCKFATGKVQFTVGEHTAELPFSGWTRLLEPPPFLCPHTDRSTFHLAATDDGRIAAAESIEVCAETGRRLLPGDLETCAETGRRVVPELLAECPVSGQKVLQSQFVPCQTCRQQVSPKALHQGECAACRSIQPADKGDPRLKALFAEHPLSARWGNWRISETATIYIVWASSWFRRLLLVADKDSLELKRVATASRFSGGWTDVAPSECDSLLEK